MSQIRLTSRPGPPRPLFVKDTDSLGEQLQFEVFQHRMVGEYNAEVVMTPMGKKTVRWIKPEDLDERMSSSRNILAKDRFDNPLFLFENQFAERWFADKYPDVVLSDTPFVER